MRFTWVPSTSDSVYPFIVGVCEFVLVELHAPEHFGWWFVCLAIIFALMTWVSHSTMRRARQDGENDEFFARLAPATRRDFYPAYGIISALMLAGIYLTVSGNRGLFALVAVVTTVAFLLRQFVVAARFWDMSVSD
jgi:phosphatidylglycerophosphate synthase